MAHTDNRCCLRISCHCRCIYPRRKVLLDSSREPNQLYCRVAARKSLPRPGTGILCRWYDRRADHRSIQDRFFADYLSYFRHALQGDKEDYARDCEGIERGRHSGGISLALGKPVAYYCPIDSSKYGSERKVRLLRA